MLLAAPVLPGRVEILVRGRIESKPYVNLTIQRSTPLVSPLETKRLVGPTPEEPQTLFIVEGEGYRTPGAVSVEGDWSNAAFWLCAGALSRYAVTVRGISLNSVQGDRTIMAALVRFGAKVTRGTDAATVRPDRLHGFELSARDIPDLGPIVSAGPPAPRAKPSSATAPALRIKESDRLLTTTETLQALGADIRIEGDSLVIEGRETLDGGTIEAHNDHRIAMTAAIAASRCERPVTIVGGGGRCQVVPLIL